MRKATLLIAVLLCFGLATAFAGPVEVEPEYEAEASATWGVQLDDQASGFQNSAESTIMFTFIEEQTAEYGEGTTYGYIEVEDFEAFNEEYMADPDCREWERRVAAFKQSGVDAESGEMPLMEEIWTFGTD